MQLTTKIRHSASPVPLRSVYGAAGYPDLGQDEHRYTGGTGEARTSITSMTHTTARVKSPTGCGASRHGQKSERTRLLRRNMPNTDIHGTIPASAHCRLQRVRRCVLGTVSRESEPVDRADQRHILGRNLKVEHLSVFLTYPDTLH